MTANISHSLLLCGVLLFLQCIFSAVLTVDAACQQASFTDKWSVLGGAAWNTEGANVVIPQGKRVLMDLTNTTVLNSIVIDGELVFDDSNTEFRFRWMRVNAGGKLLIGSEDCPIVNKIQLIFYGARTTASDMGNDPSDSGPLGSKGISVVTNGHIEMHGKVNSKRLTWTRLSATALKDSNQIVLDQSVAGLWQPGDSIVIASTDYHSMYRWDSELPPSLQYLRGRGIVPDQNEEAVIKSVSGNTVTLTSNLLYTHWGEGFERAEVGLLNRRILLKSDDVGAADRFGGHIIIRAAQTVKLSGIELYNMGQSGIMGRYSVHFHLEGDMSGRGFYVRDSSIRQSFQRCVAIHDSNGILVENNVAFDVYGHCYFLEDGGERANTFDHNLGIKVKSVDSEGGLRLIPSDTQSSVFWITNPNNTFTNNAAVGAVFGYWFSMGESPVGMSTDRYSKTDPYVKPRMTPLGKFDSNVAHSCFENGLHIDDMLNPDETLSMASYTPRVPPYNNDAGQTKELWELDMVDAHFTNFVSYKNRRYGSWSRGGPLKFSNFVLLDNLNGFNAVPGPSYLEDSLVIGETDNVGIAILDGERGRSRPYQWSVETLIKGVETYDNFGPQYVRNVTFKNFVSDGVRPAGALGSLNNGPFVHHTRNRYVGLKFDNANKAYVSTTDVNGDNPFHCGIHDLDGSVVGRDSLGVAGGWYVSNNDLMTSKKCTVKPEWNGYSCPYFGEGFVQLVVTDINADTTDHTGVDGIDYSATYKDEDAIKASFYKLGSQNEKRDLFGRYTSSSKFQLEGNIRARTGYTVRYRGNTPTPKNLLIRMDNAAIGDWIVLAIPYPKSALPFTITSARYGGTPSPLTQVTKLGDVEYNTYYYDTTGEHLYLKFENNQLNTWDTLYTERWGFVDYNFNGISVTVTASCTKCSLSSNKVAIPSQVSTTENTYQADLQMCQMPGKVEGSGSGVGYLYFLPNRRELQLNIHHDLSESVAGLVLLQGNPKETQRTIEMKNSYYSPIRTSVQLSHGEWTSLVKGELYVKVSTAKNPNGELMGRIMCSGSSCALPPAIPSLQTACRIDQSAYYKIYEEGSDVPGWPTWGFWVSVWPAGEVEPVANFASTEQPLCGANSLKIDMQYGAVTLAHAKLDPTDPSYKGTPEIDTSKYDFFEFFVKTANGEAKINFEWSDMNDKQLCSIDVTQKYISNYKIDSTAWSRVRVPLTDMNFSGVQQVKTFSVMLTDQDKKKTLYIDSIRFVNSKKYNDPSKSSSSSSILTKYKSTCADPNSPGTVSGASALSPIRSVIWMVALIVMSLLWL